MESDPLIEAFAAITSSLRQLDGEQQVHLIAAVTKLLPLKAEAVPRAAAERPPSQPVVHRTSRSCLPGFEGEPPIHKYRSVCNRLECSQPTNEKMTLDEGEVTCKTCMRMQRRYEADDKDLLPWPEHAMEPME